MSTAPSGTPARERGGCLTAYLVLALIGSLFGLYSALTLGSTVASLAAQGITVPEVPSWYLPAQIVIIVITLAAIYGIWSWKKWGVYALGVAWVLSLVASVVGGQSIVTPLIILVVEAAILWYVLRGKWAQFEG